ncbi:MAG: nicotinate (nicotinamide) nucleotide adenylyltransferase [Salinispira sp.]
MRVALFGGSFDPPHKGHEHIVQEVFRLLHPHCLYLVPAFQSPLKNPHHAGAQERLAMLELMRDVLNRKMPKNDIRIFSAELERAGTSYTRETIQTLRKKYPDAELYLIVGDDILNDLPKWKDWQSIFSTAQIAVFARSGSGAGNGSGAYVKMPNELEKYASSVHFMENEIYHISSAELREALIRKMPVEMFIDEAVHRYIREHSLYIR